MGKGKKMIKKGWDKGKGDKAIIHNNFNTNIGLFKLAKETFLKNFPSICIFKKGIKSKESFLCEWKFSKKFSE